MHIYKRNEIFDSVWAHPILFSLIIGLISRMSLSQNQKPASYIYLFAGPDDVFSLSCSIL